MQLAYLRNLQQFNAPAGAAAQEVRTLAVGAAHSLQGQRATMLRVAQGQAWVTLGDGPHGQAGERAGDGFLHAGQSLRIPAGQRVVVESVGTAPLQYRLQAVERAQALPTWWQRAQVGPGGAELCCA